MIVFTSQENLEKTREKYGDKKGIVIKVIDTSSSGDIVKEMAKRYLVPLSKSLINTGK